MRINILWILLLAPILSISGCQNTGNRANEPVSDFTEEAQHVRRDFITETESELNEIEREISDLSKKVEERGEAASAEVQEQINDLEAKFEDAENTLNELRSAGEDSWAQLKDEMDDAMDTLNETYREVESKV